jgi:hypothetical protein
MLMTTLHTHNRRRAKAQRRLLGFVIGKHRWKYPMARKLSRFHKRMGQEQARRLMDNSDDPHPFEGLVVISHKSQGRTWEEVKRDANEFAQMRNGPRWSGDLLP